MARRSILFCSGCHYIYDRPIFVILLLSIAYVSAVQAFNTETRSSSFSSVSSAKRIRGTMNEDVLQRLISFVDAKSYRIAVSLAFSTWLAGMLWIFGGLGGVGRSGTQLFNWHPLIAMTVVLIILPLSVLAWKEKCDGVEIDDREKRFSEKKAVWNRTKIVHALSNIFAFIMLNVAVAIAYASHVQQGYANFYSVHSWVGMACIFLMKGNVFGAVLSNCFECAKQIKGVGLVHKRIGGMAVIFAFAALVLGISEQQTFLTQKTNENFSVTSVFGGIIAVAGLLVGVLVVRLLSKEKTPGKQADSNELA